MSESRIPMEHLAWALDDEAENPVDPKDQATEIVQAINDSFKNEDDNAIGGSLLNAWTYANNGDLQSAHSALSNVLEIVSNQVAQLEQLI